MAILKNTTLCKHLFSVWDQYTKLNPQVTDLQVRVHNIFTKTDVPLPASSSCKLQGVKILHCMAEIIC